MNKNILYAFMAGATAIGLASCDENSWNDHYLDGFEAGVDYDDSQTGTYTITADNYGAISKLLQNEATTDAEKAAAKAIETNMYFNQASIYPAETALLPFLNSTSFPYYLGGNGSTVDITYNVASDIPAELTDLQSAKTYTVSTSDYSGVWGSPTAFISSFAPKATASSKLPAILASEFSGDNAVVDGTYAVVTYNTASEDPTFGFPAEVPASAELFTESTFKAGTYVIGDPANFRVAANLASDKTYGYLPSSTVSAAGNSVSGFNESTDEWTFISTGTDGEFYMTDGLGRYYYQTTFDSFNVSDAPVAGNDGYIWTVTAQADNTWEIKNKGAAKWLQTPSGTYSTWGSYNSAKGAYPKLYVPVAQSEPVEVP